MQTKLGDSKSFSEPNPGTVQHYGAKLGQRAQKKDWLASLEFMKRYSADNKPANFM